MFLIIEYVVFKETAITLIISVGGLGWWIRFEQGFAV